MSKLQTTPSNKKIDTYIQDYKVQGSKYALCSVHYATVSKRSKDDESQNKSCSVVFTCLFRFFTSCERVHWWVSFVRFALDDRGMFPHSHLKWFVFDTCSVFIYYGKMARWISSMLHQLSWVSARVKRSENILRS